MTRTIPAKQQLHTKNPMNFFFLLLFAPYTIPPFQISNDYVINRLQSFTNFSLSLCFFFLFAELKNEERDIKDRDE